MGWCAKSIRNELSKGKMISSEETSRAMHEMSNMELIELTQTSATDQCLSCLKHAPEGLNICQCGVWLRPNQSMMERIREAFAALKTPYFRTTTILSRGRKSGHNPWQTDLAKAMDARRGATKNSCNFTSVLDRWQNDEIYRASQLVHGRTEEYVNYRDYISQIGISYESPDKQWNRYESSLFMRGVDSNQQAGPLCQRPDYKSSANSLVSIQREQGKGVPHISMHLRTRQRDTLDSAVQQHLEGLSFNWMTYFSSSSSSTWTGSPTWWSSSSWAIKGWQDLEWRDQR